MHLHRYTTKICDTQNLLRSTAHGPPTYAAVAVFGPPAFANEKAWLPVQALGVRLILETNVFSRYLLSNAFCIIQ